MVDIVILPSEADAPILDWTKGEIVVPATYLAFMVEEAREREGEEEKDIWNDVEVLRFLQTHQYGASAHGSGIASTGVQNNTAGWQMAS